MMNERTASSWRLGLLAGLALAWSGLVSGQVIERVSVNSAGEQITDRSADHGSISADGRYVVFISESAELVPGGNGTKDVYLHDRELNTTEQISLDMSGSQPNDESESPWVSPRGRYVLFQSMATDLTPGVTGWPSDIYLRDRQLGTNERISVALDGGLANNDSTRPTGSDDLSRVAFGSLADNLVVGDTNGGKDVFVADRGTGLIRRVSVASDGAEAENDSGVTASERPEISADGRFVVFESNATNLVEGDTNGVEDVFVHELATGITERVSVGPGGQQAIGGRSISGGISADGRFVVFSSFASNLVADDTNGASDVFVHDRATGVTERVSVGPSEAQANGSSGGGWGMSISANGRVVVFSSSATNLVPESTTTSNVYVHDRLDGVTRRLGESQGGDEPSAGVPSLNGSAISARGDRVVFRASAPNLVPNDTNGLQDIFVAEYSASTDLNSAPVAQAGTATTVEDTAVTITLSGSDIDADTLTFSIDTPPSNGSLGSITQLTATTAELTYTPNADFNGTDSFSFIANDGALDSAVATVVLSVDPVNDAPTFSNSGNVASDEDAGAQTVANWASELDDGDGGSQNLTFVTLDITNPALFLADPAVDAISGDLTYTAAPDANGSSEITLELVDDGGTADGGEDTSTPVTFTIVINPVNDAPQADAGSATTDEESPVTITLTGNDIDGDSLNFAIVTPPSGGILGAINEVDSTTAEVIYTPAPGFSGNDSFIFTVDDGDLTSAAETIAITVRSEMLFSDRFEQNQTRKPTIFAPKLHSP